MGLSDIIKNKERITITDSSDRVKYPHIYISELSEDQYLAVNWSIIPNRDPLTNIPYKNANNLEDSNAFKILLPLIRLQ